MELEFRENTQNCLKRAVWGVKSEEQTLEIRLPDAMPDIGRVLGARGQPLLRGKEWRGSSISVNGGVMVWVLYAPEDGSVPRTVEGWMPFGLRWEMPEACRDGSILTDLRLESIDSRSVSARKLLIRATVSGAVEALTPEKIKLCQPIELPPDVQVLRQTYPMQLPAEAGERVFELEEELPLPEGCTQAEKLLYCTLQPRIAESKLMGDKLVFRGVAQLHVLLRCEGGVIRGCDYPVPFSQYAELEQLYEENAQCRVVPGVTSLEVDLSDALRLKAGIVGQYAVSMPTQAEVIADAYSTQRTLELKMEQLELPSVLDRRTFPVTAMPQLPACREVSDVFVTAGHPRQSRAGEHVELTLPGTVQVLCTDHEGGIMGEQQHWEGQTSVPADRSAELFCAGVELKQPMTEKTAESLQVQMEGQMEIAAISHNGIPAVTGIRLGEPKQEAKRPSLILRRTEGSSLWETAKTSGSTVEAILAANELTEEQQPGTLLLIPVLQ